MKKMKKVVAMLLALAMVLGMSLTAFATGTNDTPQTATITIENVGEAANIRYVKIIEPDRTSSDGWKYTDSVKEFFADIDLDDFLLDTPQQTTDNSELVGLFKDMTFTFASANAQISNGVATFEVAEGGLYYVDIQESNATYNPIVVYVSYDANGDIVNPDNINAKKTTDRLTKEMTNENKVIAVGDTLPYQIKSIIPYIEDDNENEEEGEVTGRYYYIYDNIKGAGYVTTTNDDEEEVVPVTVKITGTDYEETYYATLEDAKEGFDKGFKLDLTELLGGGDEIVANAYANKEVVVTYNAKVTGLFVYNEANATGNVGDEEYGSDTNGQKPKEDPEDPNPDPDPDPNPDPDPDAPKTGSLTLTKLSEETEKVEGEDEEKPITLAGAGFVVMKDGKYAICELKGDGVYKFTGEWLEAESAAEAVKTKAETEVFTGEDGTVVVKGLGSGTYEMVETTAPTGYKLESNTVKLTIEESSKDMDYDSINPKDDFTNYKLSALPSTGGMGTMIFTIGGCLIMIIAAGLFFASRRKSAK